MNAPSPSRRTLVKGAAWSVPVVAVASAAPAVAVSPACVTITGSCRTGGCFLFFCLYNFRLTLSNSCGTTATITNVRAQFGGLTVAFANTTIAGGGSVTLREDDVPSVGNPGTTGTVSFTVDGRNVTVSNVSFGACTNSSSQQVPADGTTFDYEGHRLTVRRGQLVDESGRVISSEGDLEALVDGTAPATTPQKPATDLNRATPSTDAAQQTAAPDN